MRLNLSKFKKISDDPQKAVLQHPAGHKITIAKKSLSKEMHGELNALPMHFAEGGDVSSDDSSNKPVVVNVNNGPQPSPQRSLDSDDSVSRFGNVPRDIASNNIQDPNASLSEKEKALDYYEAQKKQQDILNAQGKASQEAHDLRAAQIQQRLQALNGQPSQSQPASPSGAAAPMPNDVQAPGGQSTALPQANADPYGMQGYQDQVVTGLNEQKAGLFGAARAAGNAGAQEASALGEGIQKQQLIQDRFEQAQNQLLQEREGLQKDLQNQHIDPNHYIDSMSTGKKIRTVLGLLIGGLGGPQNAAYEMLQKHIQNDIDAQQSELGKKKNLLDFNNQTLGNSRLASDMSRVMTGDIISAHLKQIAAKNQGSQESFRALQAAGQLDVQSAGLTQQIAQRKALLDMMNPQGSNQAGSALSPEQKIAMFASTPQEAEAAGKELTAMKNHDAQVQTILRSFNQAKNENTLAGRVGRAGFEPPSIGVLQSQMMPYLKDAEGRINEQELIRTDKLMPKPGDKDSTIQTKLQGLQDFLDEKAPHPVLLPKYGINLKPRLNVRDISFQPGFKK